MAASLLLACDLNEQKLPSLVLLREESGVDGSFLITSLLGQRLKVQGAATVLVCLQHPAQHYASAGMRLGFNTNAARDRGSLVLVEPLRDISEKLFESKYAAEEKGAILEALYDEIAGQVQRLQDQNKHNCTVAIDNVAALVDLGCCENAVLRFCSKLVEFASQRSAAVVLKLNVCDLYELISRNLEDASERDIQIVRLKSGSFKEVDGKVICRKRATNGYDTIEKSFLYKINDRNIKIFQPGEVGVKL